MMKYRNTIKYLGLSTLLLLAACSGSDPLEPTPGPGPEPEQQTAISFSGGLPEEEQVTRATGLEEVLTGDKSFQVWGYKNDAYDDGTAAYTSYQTVMPGFTVNWGANTAHTTTSNTDDWEYVGQGADQTIKYWDWGAQAYRFFAATKFDKNAAVPATVAEYDANKAYGTSGTNTYSVSMLANTADIKDNLYFSRLWYSTGNPTNYPDKQFGKPVTLEFVKPYARVRFIYNYVYPREGITLSGQSFLPTNGSEIKRKGVVTVTYPLSGAETQESYSTTQDDTSDSTYICEDFDPDNDTKTYYKCDKGWYTVIPNLTQDSYTLTVRINNSDKTAVVPAEYMQWKPGYSYTYIFKITDKGGIEIGWVDYKVTPWTEMEVSKSVYNW